HTRCPNRRYQDPYTPRADLTEDARVTIAFGDLPPQDIGVRAICIVTLRADLDLFPLKFVGRVDDQRSGSGSDVDHHALLEAPLLVVLCHPSELTQRWS